MSWADAKGGVLSSLFLPTVVCNIAVISLVPATHKLGFVAKKRCVVIATRKTSYGTALIGDSLLGKVHRAALLPTVVLSILSQLSWHIDTLNVIVKKSHASPMKSVRQQAWHSYCCWQVKTYQAGG